MNVTKLQIDRRREAAKLIDKNTEQLFRTGSSDARNVESSKRESIQSLRSTSIGRREQADMISMSGWRDPHDRSSGFDLIGQVEPTELARAPRRAACKIGKNRLISLFSSA